jgi:lipopolysaccharide/colanic/teichoic acid biosynthesis glycosyltransferase
MKFTGAARVANYNDVSSKTIPNQKRKRIRKKTQENKANSNEYYIDGLSIFIDFLIILTLLFTYCKLL